MTNQDADGNPIAQYDAVQFLDPADKPMLGQVTAVGIETKAGPQIAVDARCWAGWLKPGDVVRVGPCAMRPDGTSVEVGL